MCALREVTQHNWSLVFLAVNWENSTVIRTLIELLYLLPSYFFQIETFLPSGRGELCDAQEIRNLKRLRNIPQATRLTRSFPTVKGQYTVPRGRLDDCLSNNIFVSNQNHVHVISSH